MYSDPHYLRVWTTCDYTPVSKCPPVVLGTANICGPPFVAGRLKSYYLNNIIKGVRFTKNRLLTTESSKKLMISCTMFALDSGFKMRGEEQNREEGELAQIKLEGGRNRGKQ